MEQIVDVHFPDLKKELLHEALTTFFKIREMPGLKKKPSTSELLDWIKLLLAEDIPPEALRSDDPKKADPAAVRRAAEERAGRAPVRAARVPAPPRRGVERWRRHAHSILLQAARGRRAGLDHRVPDAARGAGGAARASRAPRISTSCRAPAWSRTSGTSTASTARSPRTSRAPRSCSTRCCAQHSGGMAADAWRERMLSDEEKAQIEALGGWDKLIETLKKRLEEQKERHQGGNKWIGTGGTSPFGAYGYNPEGVRIGQDESRNRRAVKVWDQREFRNLDDTVELGTRNIKIALRKLRRFAREGAADELDLDGTIDSTARNAGLLDLKLRAGAAQRHQGAAVPRRRRLDGRSRARLRGAVLGRAQRVQASRIFLLPQFRVRERCGRTTGGATSRRSRRSRSCAPTATTTS